MTSTHEKASRTAGAIGATALGVAAGVGTFAVTGSPTVAVSVGMTSAGAGAVAGRKIVSTVDDKL